MALHDDFLARRPDNTGVIRHRRFEELWATLDLCLRLSQDEDEPQCMAIEAMAGAGKTTFAKEIIRAFPRREEKEGTYMPVFYVETPSPITVLQMSETMLKQLGDPAFDRGKQASKNGRIVDLMHDCDVGLIILDDLHHLISTDTTHVLTSIASWLKVLIKESNIPVLVLGVMGELDRILNVKEDHGQLARLFNARETLHPFAWNPGDVQTVQEFGKFVRDAEKVIGMRIVRIGGGMTTAEIGRADLFGRIHFATGGVVSHAMNLLRMAREQARIRGSDEIDLVDLSAAFTQRLAPLFPSKINPFAVDPPSQTRTDGSDPSGDNDGRP